jgi:hypothetical protein
MSLISAAWMDPNLHLYHPHSPRFRPRFQILSELLPVWHPLALHLPTKIATLQWHTTFPGPNTNPHAPTPPQRLQCQLSRSWSLFGPMWCELILRLNHLGGGRCFARHNSYFELILPPKGNQVGGEHRFRTVPTRVLAVPVTIQARMKGGVHHTRA